MEIPAVLKLQNENDMIYYFKKAHKFGFLNGFVLHEKDAEEWREKWVFRFWTIAYCFETNNEDLFFHHYNSFMYRTQKAAISGFNGFKSRGLKPVLVCHSVTKWQYEYLDFYAVDCLDSGGYRVKKLKKKHAFLKDGRCFDEKKKIIQLDLDAYNAAKLIYIKDNRAYAGEYGEINRIRIIQKDRLDVFHDRYNYFGIKDGMGQNNEEEFKEDRYYRLLTDLYNEVFLKATDNFDESGGCIILDAYESQGFIHKYFSKEDFTKVRAILSRHIKPEHIPVFLSDGVDTKKEAWWAPLSFLPDEKK